MLGLKWLRRLENHLCTWPGKSLPWSNEQLPAWCSRGYDLVIAFRESYVTWYCAEFRKQPLRRIEVVYPYHSTSDNPFASAIAIRNIINVQIWEWRRQPLYVGNPDHAQVHKLLDLVEAGQKKGDWICALPSDFLDVTDMVNYVPLDELRSISRARRKFDLEVIKRVGVDASRQDEKRTREQMAKEGKWSEVMYEPYEKLMRKYMGKDGSWSYRVVLSKTPNPSTGY